MNLGTQQLSEIYNALMEQFAGDPTVRVQAVGGIPPEQYEIYYDILCTSKSENGSIEITRGHAISLSIPFGYPHFPPSCRPISNTFHPDFDDAAKFARVGLTINVSELFAHNLFIKKVH